MKKNRRGTRWIDSRIQGTLIGRTLFHWIFFTITAFIAVICLQRMAMVLASDPESFSALTLAGTWEQFQPFALVMIALVPIFCLDLLVWSHRFVGPMVKISRAMRELAEGKTIEPIRLREGDYWGDVAENLNTLIKKMGHTQQSQRREPDENQARREVKLEVALPAAS